MVVELIVVWVLCEEGNRRGHFEKTVSEEFKSLIILPHASLEMNLLSPMVICIIRVFRERLKGILRFDNKLETFTPLERYQE